MNQKRKSVFMVAKYVNLNEGFYEGNKIYFKG
jgi:hypothetical protein